LFDYRGPSREKWRDKQAGIGLPMSRAHRDRVNAKVMKDPRFAKMPKEMPFDVKRMLYGGFKTIVEA